MNTPGLVRTACTARNAYNPALALTSTLVGTLVTSSNDPALRRLTQQIPASVSRRPFTRCSYAGQSTQASAQVGDENEQKDDNAQRPKQGRKGTFAGYAALMDVGGTAPKEKATRNVRDSTSHTPPIQSAEHASALPREPRSAGTRKSPDKMGGPIAQRGSLSRARGHGMRNALRLDETGSPGLGRPSRSTPDEVNSEDLKNTRPSTLDEQGSEGLGKSSARGLSKPGSAKAAEREDDSPFVSFWRENQEYERAVDDRHGWKAHMIRIGDQAYRLAQYKGELSEEESERMRSRCDYTGYAIEAERSSMDPPMPFPWVPQAEADMTENAGLRRLDQEISLFAQYVRPTLMERSGRKCVKNDVLSIFESAIGPEATCHLFGSERTGLATTTSDLDFRAYAPDRVREGKSKEEINEKLLAAMKQLEWRMKGNPRWLAVVLRVARFPIINAQHRASGIDVQIVSSPITKPQEVAIESYLGLLPTLRPLFFVVKSMLAVRGLVDVLTGGTGSYGLLMMLVASLTRGPVPPDPASQLLHFLDFYCTHDFVKNGIAIGPAPYPSMASKKSPDANNNQTAAQAHRPKTTLFRKHFPRTITRGRYIRAAYARRDPIRAGQWSIGQRRPFQPYLPCIQDPANPLNDLGRKMNAIHHIVATFDAVRAELRARVKAKDAGVLGEGESILECAVGRCHELYSERRTRVEEVGRERDRRIAGKAVRTGGKLRGRKGRKESEANV